METPESFILRHARAPYDPVKAHAYYLRTRKLKGRKKGVASTPSNSNVANTLNVRLATTKKPAVTITEQRQKEVQARVEALKGRLKVLEAILTQLIRQAQPNAPKKRTSKPVATKSTTAGTKKRTLTVAQKRDKAQKAKVAYRKTHPISAVKRKQENAKKIEEVKAKIEEVKVELKKAIARAKEAAQQGFRQQ